MVINIASLIVISVINVANFTQPDAMRPETDHSRRGTHGTRLLRALSEDGRLIFSTAEARETASNIGIPGGYLNTLLALLERDGWLTRLRRGLYARAGSAPGEMAVHPFALATRLVPNSAISHWSALHHHGLIDQVPRAVTASTLNKVVTPGMRRGRTDAAGRIRHAWEISGIRYEYFTVREAHFFGIEQTWVDQQSRVPITDRERTLLQLFISSRLFGGMGEALGVLHNHLAGLDLEKLVAHALRYNMISVAKRLGWALEREGVKAVVWKPLLEVPATGYHLLDPSHPRRGTCDRRWMLQCNLGWRRA